MKTEIPIHLSDAALAADLKVRAGREREATSHFIAGLAEFDRRRLYLLAGFPSMFAYCTEALYLSEDAAYNRIEVARTARAFPLILEMLENGRLNLATVRALASRLTQCAYVGADGRRCNTRAYVQFHHVDPYAIGGQATVERTELRCRAHNEYEAELFYGRPWRERATRPGTSALMTARPAPSTTGRPAPAARTGPRS